MLPILPFLLLGYIKVVVVVKENDVVAGFLLSDITIPLYKLPYYTNLRRTRRIIQSRLTSGNLKNSKYLCYFAARDKRTLRNIVIKIDRLSSELKAHRIQGHLIAARVRYTALYKKMGATTVNDDCGNPLLGPKGTPWQRLA
jgi:hypothetical protein